MHDTATTFLFIVIILLFAKLSSLIERIGQPPVLGELVVGVILGNLTLLGVSIFEPIKTNELIRFLAELGVVILLFQVGLESDLTEMRRVGVRALLVACVGVICPFVLGTLLFGPWLLPGLSANAYLFLGATLTATSVGITARVFRDLNTLQTVEAQIVLGAAVIDDVLGLIILAVVSAIVTAGSVSFAAVAYITLKAVIFLVAAIVLGRIAAPFLSYTFSKIHAGVGMKFTFTLCCGLLLAYLAHEIGLASIVGAFAAGLVLDPVHFRYFQDAAVIEDIEQHLNKADPSTRTDLQAVIESHAERHVETLIEPVGHFFIPIFFVLTGMDVRVETLLDAPVLLIALGITFAAFVGKIVSGLVAGSVNKAIVGFGMIPRGEVGLIFAASGKALGVVNDEVFSVIVIVIILTTLLTPPVLTFLINRSH